MTIQNTWDGCAWALALVLYPLTMIGWWLRNSGGSMRRFGPTWWSRVRHDVVVLLLWTAGFALGSRCW